MDPIGPIDPAYAGLVHWMEAKIPFNVLLGVRCERAVRGEAVIRLPWRDDLLGDTARGAVHGGVTSMLVDTAGGCACFTGLTSKGDRLSTVDLRVDYLRPGPAGQDLWCRATVMRVGNRVAVAQMQVYSGGLPPDGQLGEPIATGQGVYNIMRRREPT